MKIAIVNLNLEYKYPDNMTDEEIREDYIVEDYENGEYNLYGKLVDITNNYRRV